MFSAYFRSRRARQKLRVFSVVDSAYMQLGLAWGARVREVSGENPIFVCSDTESAECMSAQGFPCIFRPPSSVLSTIPPCRSWEERFFDSEKATYTNLLKLVAASDYLRSGYAVLYSDVDALWIRNPINDVIRHGTDFVFSCGKVPLNTKRKWGFSVCMGFWFMRPSEWTRYLIDAAVRNFSGNEQKTLNRILLDNFDIDWSDRPSRWMHCSKESGWVEPIQGSCHKSGLSLTALPHVYYQRWNTCAETCGHAIVCHPIAEQREAKKFQKFESLGLKRLLS